MFVIFLFLKRKEKKEHKTLQFHKSMYIFFISTVKKQEKEEKTAYETCWLSSLSRTLWT